VVVLQLLPTRYAFEPEDCHPRRGTTGSHQTPLQKDSPADDQAQTPFDRLCATNAISSQHRQRLHALRDQTNPRQLRQQIYQLLDYLFTLPCATPGITEDVYQTLVMPLSLPKGEDSLVTLSFD